MKFKYDVGIYQIKNIINNDIYIGKSVELKRREYDHFRELNKNIHGNIHLQRAYNFYGKENFIFEILLYCEKTELHFYEQTLVDILCPEYNICKECVNSPLGVKRSEEQKMAISERTSGSANPFYGKFHSLETKQKMKDNHADCSGIYNSMYGKTQTEESKIKNRNSQLGENGHNFGKHLPEETLKKMSEARIGEKCYMFGKKHSEKTKQKMSESHKKKDISNKNKQKNEENKIKRGAPSEETKEKQKSKNITSKEIVLKVKEMLDGGISVFEICEETKISKYTVRKIRKGFYNEYYDL